jgi:hypothetical protein
VTILRDLQAGYPFPLDEAQRGVHTLLGAVNVDITTRSIAAIAAGDLPTLGGLMLQAQTEFDRYGALYTTSVLLPTSTGCILVYYQCFAAHVHWLYTSILQVFCCPRPLVVY